MTNTDAELMHRTLHGDPEAFAMLVSRYEKPIYNLALRMLGDRDDAADVMQTVFIKAYQRSDRYDPAHAVFSWLYRIAVNESINLINRRKRRRGATVDLPSTGSSPEDDLGEVERREYIQRALSAMTLEHRIVIVLKHLLLLSYRDIAQILDIPEKTVKSRLFTARQVLRDRLLELGYSR
jgi:RNA polymerase sigma-70 factor, ECF subfamily